MNRAKPRRRPALFRPDKPRRGRRHTGSGIAIIDESCTNIISILPLSHVSGNHLLTCFELHAPAQGDEIVVRLGSDHSSFRGSLSRRIGNFKRSESGGIVASWTGVTVLTTLIASGLGLDLMRTTRAATMLQNTLDTAVLAAADLQQVGDPRTVVENYVAKAGFEGALVDVTVTNAGSFREVTATAEVDVDLIFLDNVVETVTRSSTAREEIEDLELTLVLDVSGSMHGPKMLALQDAAKEFIDEIFDNSVPDTVTLSVVPYATQVVAPRELLDALTLTVTDKHARCIDWDMGDFSQISIDPSNPLDVVVPLAHFGNSDRKNGNTLVANASNCRSTDARNLMPLASDPGALKGVIDGLQARGSTSIDLGVKWGGILLDPSFQPVASALAAADGDLVDPAHSNRPAVYTADRTMKVMVVMTDGQNTGRGGISPEFALGDSNIWWNEAEDKYSIYLGQDVQDKDGDKIKDEPLFRWIDVRERDLGYEVEPGDKQPDGTKPLEWEPIPDSEWDDDNDRGDKIKWMSHAYGNGTYDTSTTDEACNSFKEDGLCAKYNKIASTSPGLDPGSAVNLTYADLWAHNSLAEFRAWHDEIESGSKLNEFMASIPGISVAAPQIDTNTLAVCDAAKEKGIIVYTIAFMTNDTAEDFLSTCASSDSHHFDVEDLNIGDAFGTILTSIKALRLTQ